MQTSMDEDEMIDGLDETQPLYMQKIDEVLDISTFTFNRSVWEKLLSIIMLVGKFTFNHTVRGKMYFS